MLRKLRTASFKTKLLLLILLFLGFPFLFFGMLWYNKSNESIELNAIRYNQQLVLQVSSHLETYFSELERTTYTLIANPFVQQYVVQMNDPVVDTDEIFEKYIIPNIFMGRGPLGRSDIYNFSIISQSGVTTYGENGKARTVADSTIMQKYLDEMAATGGSNFQVRGISRIGNEWRISIIRKFTDMSTYQTAGLFVVELNLTQINTIAESNKMGENGYLWILGDNAKVIYHPNSGKIGKEAEASYIEEFARHRGKGYFFKTVDGQRKLVVFHRSKQNNWTIASEVPISELTGSLIQLRNFTIWIAGALILFVVLALSGFSISLTRSISHLQRLMKRAENGDLAVKAPENREDEIGGLNRSFNKMVGEIRRLIEVVHMSTIKEKEMQIKQREATMHAMQSQINPHFLYNTLEVINSYAILEGVMPISKMANSLADIFRYSVGNPRQIVALREELNHIKIYLEILKERYPYLEVENTVDEDEIAGISAVRLVIQPLVENAFFHGYEKNKLRPGYIGFSGERTEFYYILRIKDKGKGMDAEKLREYNQYFTADESTQMDSELPFQKIGLWNVHHRIRLTYGHPYGLWIESSDREGTVIQVRLPHLPDMAISPNEEAG